MRKVIYMNKRLLLAAAICMSFLGTACSSKISPNNSEEEFAGKNYEEVKQEILDAGFSKVVIKEVKDLDQSSKGKTGDVASVSIGGNSEFAKGDSFDKDSEVIITYRIPKDFHVKFNMTFKEDPSLTNYEVKVLKDNKLLETVKPGQDNVLQLSLPYGTTKLTFEKSDSMQTNGFLNIDVNDHMEAEIRLSCYPNHVDAELVLPEEPAALKDGEIQLDTALDQLMGTNYKDVKKRFENLGFKNVETKAIYNLASADDEKHDTVAEISIDGKTDLKDLTVFHADMPVVISYYAYQNEDPNHRVVDVVEDIADAYTVDNCPLLAEVLGIQDRRDPAVLEFAMKYDGDLIQFDGYIDTMTYHSSNGTIDMTLRSGSSHELFDLGAAFVVEGVNHQSFQTNMYPLKDGTNVTVMALVDGYDQRTGSILIKPASIYSR